MKLIIDIPDKDYEKLKDGHIPFSVLDVMQNGTPIPDNATNETVMKTIFPNMRIEKHCSFARFVHGEEYIPCPYSWLNATYKGDSNEIS